MKNLKIILITIFISVLLFIIMCCEKEITEQQKYIQELETEIRLLKDSYEDVGFGKEEV